MRLYSKKLWIIFTTLLVILGVSALATWKFIIPTFLPSALSNYAQEVAKPLEAALKDAGATRQCIRGDNGRGSDNDRPGYSAIYEVPGSADRAKELIRKVAKHNSFDLTEQQNTEPRDSVTYRDDTKASPYSDLQGGAVELGMQIYPDKVYAGTGDQFCAVVTPQTPVTDKTTVWIGVNLPAFKR